MKNKEKKICFNERIDSSINGYALAITFIGIGIFLLNNLTYFGNRTVSLVVLAIFSIIGMLGMMLELSKNNKIKGIDDLGVGFFLFLIWLFCFLVINKLCVNIITFFLMIIGIYGIVSGIIKIIVSIFIDDKKERSTTKKVLISFFKLLPSIASFVLVIFNILKIIFEIKGM